MKEGLDRFCLFGGPIIFVFKLRNVFSRVLIGFRGFIGCQGPAGGSRTFCQLREGLILLELFLFYGMSLNLKSTPFTSSISV